MWELECIVLIACSLSVVCVCMYSVYVHVEVVSRHLFCNFINNSNNKVKQ